jgi:translocator protein
VTALKPVSKRSIATAIAIAMATTGIGGWLTKLSPWYFALKMPEWQPPGPAFGIIWTIIYTLATISGVLVWRRIHSREDGARLLSVYAINISLNLLWSYLFFTHQRPDFALYMVGIFWLSILALIVTIWPKSKLASALLLPYLVWVGIASFLNLSIVQLNGPFG